MNYVIVMLYLLFSYAFAQVPSIKPIDEAREALLHGDRETAITISQRLLENKKVSGTLKDITRYLLATAYSQQESYLLAAEQFQKIYWGGRALQKEALFLRAKNLFLGNSYKAAISSCSKFRSKWPETQHSDSCMLIMGEAHGNLGNISNMRYFFEQYLLKYPESPKTESIRVQEGLFEYKYKRRGSREKLRYYFFNHTYPSSAAQIQKTLPPEDLIPINFDEETQQIWSLIRGGFIDEAWQKTQGL